MEGKKKKTLKFLILVRHMLYSNSIEARATLTCTLTCRFLWNSGLDFPAYQTWAIAQ